MGQSLLKELMKDQIQAQLLVGELQMILQIIIQSLIHRGYSQQILAQFNRKSMSNKRCLIMRSCQKTMRRSKNRLDNNSNCKKNNSSFNKKY